MSDSPSHLQAKLALTKNGKQIEELASDIPISSITSDDEPIVTRRELWSYYCRFPFPLHKHLSDAAFEVYYNGDNVCFVDLLF